MKSPLPPRLLNNNNAARYLGMERHTWRIVRPSLNITPVIMAQRELWDVEDLNRIIEEKKQCAK